MQRTLADYGGLDLDQKNLSRADLEPLDTEALARTVAQAEIVARGIADQLAYDEVANETGARISDPLWRVRAQTKQNVLLQLAEQGRTLLAERDEDAPFNQAFVRAARHVLIPEEFEEIADLANTPEGDWPEYE